jgi:hypothetical protein
MAARSLEGISHENNLASDIKMIYRSQFKPVVRENSRQRRGDYNKMKLAFMDGRNGTVGKAIRSD